MPPSADTSGDSKSKKKGSKHKNLPGLESATASLPWHVEFNSRGVRHAVADADMPAGTLLLVERPFLTIAASKFASRVCHRCLRPLPKNKEHAPGGNPCLPRYCPTCKEDAGDLDAKLAPLRIKIPEVATQHQIDATMLHVLALLDQQRSGIAAGAPPPPPAKLAPCEVRSSVADADALPNLWDRKPEAWRKKVGPALRALHKELVTLAASLPSYTPCSIQRLQADAAQLALEVQTINGTGAGPDTALALFPALSVFPHSCAPNCFFLARGPLLYVRTVVDVKKGEALTASYVSLTEPRGTRQQLLEAERHITCNCPRCAEPLKKSVDRWLEGVWCSTCLADVLVALPPGPATDAATEVYKGKLRADKAEADRLASRRKPGKGKAAPKPADKKAAAKDAGAAQGEQAEAEEAAAEEDPAAVAPRPADDADADPADSLPAGLGFWQCCGCDAVEPAHDVDGGGPGDIAAQAQRLLQQGNVFINTNHPQLVEEGEAQLVALQGQLQGRLCPYYHRVLDGYVGLINLSIKKSDPVAVMTYAIQLWDIERQLLDNRPTVQQLQCLEAIVEAAEHKATSASSDSIKRHYQKKLKLAKMERERAKKIMFGE